MPRPGSHRAMQCPRLPLKAHFPRPWYSLNFAFWAIYVCDLAACIRSRMRPVQRHLEIHTRGRTRSLEHAATE